MLEIILTKRYRKDIKKYQYNKKVIDELTYILTLLQKQEILPIKYKDHLLMGKYSGKRECHVMPDTLLIYVVDKQYCLLERIGSHAELF